MIILNDRGENLSRDELDLVGEAIQLLEPFDEANTEISAEKYVTVSKILALINIITEFIIRTEVKTSIGPSSKTNLVSEIIRFESYENRKICAFSSVLDPRFKQTDFS